MSSVEPVTKQPRGGMPPAPPGAVMAMPDNVAADCPPGLEYMTQVDNLIVKQTVELLEAFTGYETNNKYAVTNVMDQRCYYAVEDSNCCNRNCCGPIRAFSMKILDNSAQEVMHIERNLRCTSCWFPCCLQSMDVYAPPGKLIGRVEQGWSAAYPVFHIVDDRGDTQLTVKGPCCTCSICGDVEFDVTDRRTGGEGKITKQWSGFAKETFTDADVFGVRFPPQLEVRTKATLLAATFLIDFMFFERKGNKRKNDAPGMADG